MGIFDRLFGNKPEAPQADSSPPPPPSAGPEGEPEMIRVFDPYGREMWIARDEWRTRVLPANLRKHWDDPGELYGVIVSALGDGFAAEVAEAAEHLHRIDPIPARGATVCGIVLMKNGRLDEAERVLAAHVERHGEEGVVLTNLAKVYAERGEEARAEETLWRALRADPNQDNGLAWYEAMHRERSGGAAGAEAMRRVAALPGSWRAHLWLARAALGSGDRDGALALYRESLSRAGAHVPADALMQISGDLGNHGLPGELVRVAEPHFRAEIHGPAVGNNLIKAWLELGDAGRARAVLDQLHALNRPDWREVLQYWDHQIARAGLDGPVAAPVRVSLRTVDGPVWLAPSTPAAGLFSSGVRSGPVVAFLGSSAETGAEVSEVQRQLSDDPGRASRWLPLFLAEQAELRGGVRAFTLVPWVEGNPGGFAFYGEAWGDAESVEMARRENAPADFVATIRLRASTEPWTVEVRLIRAADGECVGTLSAAFASRDPGSAVRDLARRLNELLAERAGAHHAAHPPLYELPAGEWLASYLLRLEQLLAVRCSVMEGGAPGTLNGEREIVDGNLRLCLAAPQSVSTRILLARTLASMRKVRPAVVAEFAERVTLLQKEHPLPEPAHGVVREILEEALSP